MSKFIFLGASAAIAGAAVYYVSPAHQSDPDVPPVVTDMPPVEVMRTLAPLTFKSFMQQYQPSSRDEDVTRGAMRRVAPDEYRMDISFFGDKIVALSFKVRPGAFGKTQVDIRPTIPDSRLARSKDLHPYDLKAMAAISDVMASEYVSSVLNRQRMANTAELQGELISRVGFSQDQGKAFEKRFVAALLMAYRDRIVAMGGRDPAATENHWVSDAGDPGEPAMDAARAARDAAAEASEAAAAAAAVATER